MSKNNKKIPVIMRYRDMISMYESTSQASRRTGVSQSYISKLVRSGKIMKCGMKFVYDESINLGEV